MAFRPAPFCRHTIYDGVFNFLGFHPRLIERPLLGRWLWCMILFISLGFYPRLVKRPLLGRGFILSGPMGRSTISGQRSEYDPYGLQRRCSTISCLDNCCLNWYVYTIRNDSSWIVVIANPSLNRSGCFIMNLFQSHHCKNPMNATIGLQFFGREPKDLLV